ncbi:PAS domain S-box protein [Leptospira ryugenii]|uniref:histidine kinase n=1 Tax=Leptospira ryugenii TaxID=1917863 RepID=A0A2P2E0J0_9LEPT|nr:PAS domain S-box protein [Leptospira ryugenii]GBF50389.1 PAS domain S-box protein [Leptospira ryugenii]
MKPETTLGAIIDKLPVMYLQYTFYPDGTSQIFYVSDAVRDIYGIEPEKALQDASLLWYQIDPEHISVLLDKINQSAKLDKSWSHVWKIRQKTGKQLWVYGQATPERQSDGSILWNSITLDITEYQSHQERLIQNASISKAILDQIPDAIFSLDRNLCYTSFNESHRQYMKSLYGHDISIGQNAIALLPEGEIRDSALEKLKKAFAGEIVSETAFHGNSEDARQAFELRHNPIYDQHQSVIGVAILAIENTDQVKTWKELEELNHKLKDSNAELKSIELELQKQKDALEQSERKYRQLVESQTEFVTLSDPDTKIEFANAALQKALGLAESEILGKRWKDFAIPEDLHMIEEKILSLDPDHHIFLWENRDKRANGELGWTAWINQGIFDEGGNLIKIHSVGRDITELKNSYQQALDLLSVSSEQNKKLKNFTYIVSHNLRSHSANIKGILELLQLSVDPEEKNKLFDLLHFSANRLEETIHNLNEILTIQENNLRIMVRINLGNEIKKTLDVLTNVIASTKCTIHLEIEHNIFVKVIPAYLESVLLNVIGNAIKYRSPVRDPKVWIRTEETAEYLVLQIEDNGLGIDLSKYENKIFGMYKTFHGNEDAKGFGLYLAKTQMESMGGKINVQSEVNKGSTFSIYFQK